VSRSKFSAEDKLEILTVVESGKYSLDEIASMYSVDKSTIKTWRYNLEHYGAASLSEATTSKRYSVELKNAAIEDFLSDQYSLREIARKYEISDKGVLRRWIQKYNEHREIKAGSKGMSHSMTKGRSTTLKERIDIVLYCLSNQKDYRRAAEAYDVSYQQVYSWVRKYEVDGEEALKDGRGTKKPEPELSPEDKTNREMKKLQRENERLRAENEFLKKLEELERRRF
jgi:transposase